MENDTNGLDQNTLTMFIETMDIFVPGKVNDTYARVLTVRVPQSTTTLRFFQQRYPLTKSNNKVN